MAPTYLRGRFDPDAEGIARAIQPRPAHPSAPGVDRDRPPELDVSTFRVSRTIACAEPWVRQHVEYVLSPRVPDGRCIVSTAWEWAEGVGPRADG